MTGLRSTVVLAGLLVAAAASGEAPRQKGTTPIRSHVAVPRDGTPPDEAVLDSSPVPVSATVPEQVRAAPELPAPAASGAWRAGARPPGEVPASVVVKAAGRRRSARGKAAAGEAEPSRVIEILWNAPGS